MTGTGPCPTGGTREGDVECSSPSLQFTQQAPERQQQAKPPEPPRRQRKSNNSTATESRNLNSGNHKICLQTQKCGRGTRGTQSKCTSKNKHPLGCNATQPNKVESQSSQKESGNTQKTTSRRPTPTNGSEKRARATIRKDL